LGYSENAAFSLAGVRWCLGNYARTAAHSLMEPGQYTRLQLCAKVMFEYMHRTKTTNGRGERVTLFVVGAILVLTVVVSLSSHRQNLLEAML